MFYTQRLMLRSFDARCDTNTWMQWMNDAVMARTIRPDAVRPSSLDEIKAMMSRLGKGEGLPVFAVCLRPAESEHPAALPTSADLHMKKDGTARYPMIGVLILRGQGSSLSFTNRVAELGIGFSKEYQGSGYGTETMKWACAYIFQTLGLHRIELNTEEDNTRAIRCYQKLGFVEEGRRRGALFVNGKWQDAIMLGMLVEEWQEQNGGNVTGK